MTTCGSLALLGGCHQDADLKNSHMAAQDLEKLSKDYTNQLAELSHGADMDQVAMKLEGLAREVSAVKGTSPAQKKSATMLTATISAAVGSLRADEFTKIELDQMILRNKIATNAYSAMIVGAGAMPRSQTSFAEAADGIAMKRESFMVQSDEIGDRLSEHQSNAAQLRQQQERTSQQLDQMTLDAARLGRQAKDAGPIEAYPLIEESAEIRTRMIPVKAKVADAESQLALIVPQVENTDAEKANITSMIEATVRAERNIGLMGEAVTAAGDAGNQRAATQIGEVERLVTEYLKTNADSAMPIFQSAISNLEKAQRSGSSKGARALAAGASRMMGDLQAMRANGANAEARLFNALAATDSLTGAAAEAWKTKAAAAVKEHEVALEAARTAYQDALDKLVSAGGSEATRATIQQLMEALDGTQIETEPIQMEQSSSAAAPATQTTTGSASMDSSFTGMGTRGFDSPEALLGFMTNLQQSSNQGPGVMQKVMGVMYLEDPQVLMQAQQDQKGMQNILSSLSDQSNNSGQPSAKVVALQSDSAELSISNMPVNIPLIKVDGKWYINLSRWLTDARNYQDRAGRDSGGDANGNGRSGRGSGRSGR
jgi:hypothetical protein